VLNRFLYTLTLIHHTLLQVLHSSGRLGVGHESPAPLLSPVPFKPLSDSLEKTRFPTPGLFTDSERW
jgi:hypothetical protein